MNILFLTSSCVDPTKGGVQKITYSLMAPLRESGNSVYILSWKKNGKQEDENQFFLSDDKKVCSIDNIRFLHDFVKEKNIEKIVNQQGISIDFMNLLVNLPPSIEILSIMHNSLLAHVHNFYYIHEYTYRKKHLNWLLSFTKIRFFRSVLLGIYCLKNRKKLKKIVANSNKVVFLSDKLVKELAYFFSLKEFEHKLAVIPNFIDVEKKNVTQLLKNKEKRLLYVGRIDFSMKRVDLLLEIWSKIYQDFPDWELDVLGGNEQEINTLNEIAIRLGLERVNFVGFARNDKYYERASIYCMTSCAESFGMVLIEAMSYATVPIAFNSYPTVVDIIDTGENGILIDNMNLDLYVTQLTLLMREEGKRKRMANRALEKSFVFSKDTVIVKWNTVLNQ